MQFLHSCADIGYAKTRQQVLLLVQQIVKKKGLNVKVTNGRVHTPVMHAAYNRVLVLSKQDEEILLNGGWLTATHIAAVHNLLRKTFPNQEGLNDTSVLSEK